MIRRLFAVVVVSASLAGVLSAVGTRPQQSTNAPGTRAPAVSPPVKRLGPNLYRFGLMQVDTAKREVAVPGQINDVGTLEFVACTRGGVKAYESAVTLHTDAVSFNAAMLLIGLDRTRGRVPTRHFDPDSPAGDPVEITFAWNLPGSQPGAREPVEQLLFNVRTRQTVPQGSWVYTGSTLMPGGKYLAELDGVLIGFVHSPAPVIEHVGGLGLGDYGNIILNPSFRAKRPAMLTLFVRALDRATGKD